MLTAKRCHLALSCLLLAGISCSAFSDEPEGPFSQLLKMDITELMNVKVVLPSRTEERQFDAPNAIYVINQEEIRRSGLTRIPELLRMVPGLHVGRLDQNTWAISSRTSMTRFSNSMLVLLDGRTLYNPLFGGVYWDVQDTFIEDIERIEIIRGPGGSLWGANAVDGIINIVTKSAEKTGYTTVFGGVGDGEKDYEVAVRLGHKFDSNSAGRVYAKKYKTSPGEYLTSEESTNPDVFEEGADADDDGENAQAGFRFDWATLTGGKVTFQGDAYNAKFHNIRSVGPAANTVHADGHNFIVNWQIPAGDSSEVSMQIYFDNIKRRDDVFEEKRDIYDFDFQHSLSLHSNVLTWGLGARHISDDTTKVGTGIFELDPDNTSENIYSAFMQDKIELLKDALFFTFGTKFENNKYTGGEIQPTARMLWKINNNRSIWAALTKAVRTPNRSELHARLNSPSFGIVPIGDPDEESEGVVATEFGFRSMFTNNMLIDISLFNHQYTNPNNDNRKLDATHGVETVVNYSASERFRLKFAYTWHESEVREAGATLDNGNVPQNSINLRALWDVSQDWEFDVFLYYKDGLEATTLHYEDYLRADVRLGWNPNNNLRFSLLTTNAFDDLHAEIGDTQRINTAVGRTMFLSVNYDMDK